MERVFASIVAGGTNSSLGPTWTDKVHVITGMALHALSAACPADNDTATIHCT